MKLTIGQTYWATGIEQSKGYQLKLNLPPIEFTIDEFKPGYTNDHIYHIQKITSKQSNLLRKFELYYRFDIQIFEKKEEAIEHYNKLLKQIIESEKKSIEYLINNITRLEGLTIDPNDYPTNKKNKKTVTI